MEGIDSQMANEWTFVFGPVPPAAPVETPWAASSEVVRVPGPSLASHVFDLPPPPCQIQIGKWIYNRGQDHGFEIVRLGVP